MTRVAQLKSELEALLSSARTFPTSAEYAAMDKIDRRKAKDIEYQYQKRFSQSKAQLEDAIKKLVPDPWQLIERRIEALSPEHINKTGLLAVLDKTPRDKLSTQTARLQVTAGFRHPPTLADVIRDINAAKKPQVIESNLPTATIGIKNDQYGTADLFESLICGEKLCLSGFDIPATDHGLKACGPRAISTEGHHHITDYTSVTTAVGYTTLPHLDSTLSAACILLIQGEKLWYSWEYTAHNARTWELNMSFIDCIEKLNALTIHHLRAGEGIIITPACIHGVISLTAACLVGYRIYDDFKLCIKKTSWFLDMLDKQSRQETEAVINNLNDIYKELDLWRSLNMVDDNTLSRVVDMKSYHASRNALQPIELSDKEQEQPAAKRRRRNFIDEDDT